MIAAVACVLVAASCGGSDDDGAESETPSDTATASETADTQASASDTGTETGAETGATETEASDATSDEASSSAAPDVNYDLDAVLRYAISSDPPTMDPHRVPPGQVGFMYPGYDALTFLDPNGVVGPMLATSWEYQEDPPSLTLELREGVTFDSGTPFDAEAVRANLERAMTDELSVVAPSLEGIVGMEVVDSHTITLELDRQYPELPIVLAERPGMMIDPTMFDSESLATEGAGIGPFNLTSWQQGTRMEWTKSEDYWDPEVQKLAGMEYLVIPDVEAAFAAFETGQVDMVELFGPQLPRAEAAGYELVSREVLETEQFLFNGGRAEFGDQKVRQAMMHAVDRQGIVDALMAGVCVPTNQFAPEGHLMHSGLVDPDAYAFDLDRARELLAEAGLADGFSFEALVVNTPLRLGIAQVIQQNLAEIGVTMTIQPVAGSDIVNAFYVSGEGDAIVSGDQPTAAPSQYAADRWAVDGFRNPGSLTTDEIAGLVDDVRALPLGSDEVEQAWEDLTAAAIDFGYTAQICRNIRTIAIADNVVDFEIYFQSVRQLRGVGLLAE